MSLAIQHKTILELISEAKLLNNNLLPVKEHSKGISEYLSYSLKSDKIYHWFHIGGSIIDISYNGITYDSSFEMCRPSYEHEKEKQNLYSDLVNEISFFLYVFNGLECLLSKLSLLDLPTGNKFQEADKLIKAIIEKGVFEVKHFKETLDLYKSVGKSLFEDFKNLERKEKNFCIAFVYNIRNKISHGDFSFPEVGDYPPYSKLFPLLINLSSRLTLYSTQYLLMSIQKESNYFELYYSSLIDCYHDFEDGFFIKDFDYLKNIHLREVKWQELNFSPS